MAIKLADWEIENGIRVESILRKPSTPYSVEFVAVRYLHKMEPEQKAEYIKLVNKEKYDHDKAIKDQKDSVQSKKL